MHEFDNDFYGANLKIVMLGYIRPMSNFKSLDDLIAAIKKDIADANEALDQPQTQTYQSDVFFTPVNVKL